ncbi:MAG: DUF502 domain-containing protein [Candidatus Methanofastidiosia archaeon]
MLRKLRNYFIAGLVVVIPTIVTFYILYWAFIWTDNLLGKYLKEYISFHGRQIYGLGIVLVVVVVLVVGMFATNYFGRTLISSIEKFILRLPLVKKIYSASKEISDAVLSEKKIFQRVVLVEYPRKGVYSLGFVTSESRGEIQAKTRRNVLNVFLATTPNPTSGMLIMVPEDETLPLDMTVEEGMKLIISGGFVVPLFDENQLRLKSKAKMKPTDIDPTTTPRE